MTALLLRPSAPAALALLAFLPLGAPAFQESGADAVLERVIELGRSDSRVQEHLRYLCETIGPRLTSSHNLSRAERWTREQLASFGLDARLETWGEFSVGFDRGPARGGMVAPEPIEYVFTTNAWTPGTDGAVRARAALAPKTVEELAAARASLAGAWLVLPTGRPPAKELRQELDALPLAGEIAASGGDLVHTGGNQRVQWGSLPARVRIRLRGDQHKDLVERLERGEAVELEFDVDNRFYEGPVTLNNVVADIHGSDKADEYVIVCGHLDSWDGAQGAVDNGTGVATTLEAARLLALAGARPRRTIRFILWGGEEQGLMGSRAYVQQNADILPRISAVLNHDGGTNYLSGLSVTPEMMPVMQTVCAPLAALDPELSFELQESDGLPSFGSSDHASFVQKGVPGFFWRQSGRSDYNHHHHTQYDTFDAAIPEYQRHSALVAALVAWRLADEERLLDRTNMEAVQQRRMGVDLDGARITQVTPSGKAAEAGWREGDVILVVDGVEVSGRAGIAAELQKGGPRKTFLLQRGEERLETVLDYSADPLEARRAERAARRAQRDQTHSRQP